ncbi:MAG: trypsin-like peptidase domain-containing protein [Oscillatoria princeps RMCB-10]|jgi:WD40 repeat protein|nr:trypsin-like peptidase domain-containing protein [Oscillatoria princeps RMCB-10]
MSFNFSSNFARTLPAALLGAAIALVQPTVAVPQTPGEEAIAGIAKEVTAVVNGQNPGSGAIISRQGNTYYVLTAKHVVATPDQYEILTSDGEKHTLDYSTVKKLPGVDLAVVQFTSNKNYRVAVLGNSDTAKEGVTVYTSGWPHPGRAITQRIYQITQGRISGLPLQPLEDGYRLVYTNVTRSGMSGGPVFDDRGRVIGIHGRAEGEPIYNADTGDTVDVKSGFNLGIPINTFLKLAPQAGINLPYSRTQFSAFKTLDAGEVLSAAISPDGQTVVSGGKDGSIQLWDLRTGQRKKALTGSKAVYSLAITPDGQTLASSSAEGTVKLWNLSTGEQLGAMPGHGPLTVSRSGQLLAGSSADRKAISVWDARTGQLKKTLAVEGEPVSIAFSPDSQTLAGIDKEAKGIKIWDLHSDAPPRILKTKPVGGYDRCAAISPDAQTLVSLSWFGRVRIWNLQTGEILRSFETLNSDTFLCESASVDSNGQILAGSSWNPKEVNLWNLQTEQLVSFPNSTHPIALSPDGQTAVTGNLKNQLEFSGLKIWRATGSGDP